MIRLLTKDRTADFLRFCENRIPGAVLTSRYAAYGLDTAGILFWYAEDSRKRFTAAGGMMDGILLICSENNADSEEWTEFSKMIGARKTTCGTAQYLLSYIDGASRGNDLRAEPVTGENVKDIFPVIFESDPNRNAYFSQWYTDASHKLRHSLIHGACIYADGQCVSAALTSGETAKIAVISSVATLRKYRRQGFGARTVVSLAGALPQKVYLTTDSEQTRKWYQSIGFCPIETDNP